MNDNAIRSSGGLLLLTVASDAVALLVDKRRQVGRYSARAANRNLVVRAFTEIVS